MSNINSDAEWTAALAAWSGLDQGQRNLALGYLAVEHAQLLIQAADQVKTMTAGSWPPAGAAATVGAANTAVAHLDSRGMREVLNFLALHDPDAVLLAVRETGA